jgi:hypothetical protein
MMAGPFVSKHFVAIDVRFYPLFSNFCEHFVSNAACGFSKATRAVQAENHWQEVHMVSLFQ